MALILALQTLLVNQSFVENSLNADSTTGCATKAVITVQYTGWYPVRFLPCSAKSSSV